MDYELICIDMDGTLLNSKHSISELSKETIKKAHSMGVHIVVNTGRIYTDAEYFSNLLGVKSPVIASNGAFIKEKDKDEIIYKNILKESVCLKLIDVFSKYNVNPTFLTPDKIYSSSIVWRIFMQYLKLKGIFNKNLCFQYVPFWTKWDNIFKLEKENIIKCEVMSKDENKLKKIRDELKTIDEIEVASSTKYNIEITNKGVSKGRAVEILSSYYGIDREKIIAIGDSENDLSMIEFAGMGIAMGNAIDIVKNKADFITDTNDNNGVAKAIDKFVLKK
ncbi:hypothetical protein SAMN05428976_11030 [Clostridium sp. USBA 49]|uniref:Cof-type HAD-IIB family hydrolase n=1 Tax=Clostridium sp. USBA 49 TaxID=1881060 RepID=UPI00099939A0|nr:Cof-type HAD-IIB family hydrolase [Clostridium sp. USBA 49]SKA87653.1 hypothetical protein SAMN05428976_11030 [Clostridium sp. USBA 49]